MIDAKSGIYINFLPDELDVLVSQKDRTVLDVAVRGGVDLPHSCGGNGTCGTCRVRVLKGLESLEPRNEIEQEMAQDRNFDEDERLSCQIAPVAGLSVLID
ncbi:MAG: 2Fe-2S iron-sulfur cluster-binding protein [Bdellovibrio sp.]